MRLCCCIVLAAGLGLARDALCDLPDGVQIHGFASQGYILTTGNNFFGETIDGGAFDFRELGLNGSWRITPTVQVSLQALSRNAGETDDGALRLDYGFIDYGFFTSADDRWGLRLGRILNPFGFYNDTRDVAFIRPSILLPQSIYFDVNRNLSLSSDGAQLYAERQSEIGNLTLQLALALPRVEDPDFERAIFFVQPAPGRLAPEPSWMGRLAYESDSGGLRLMLSGGQVNVGYDPGGSDDPYLAGGFQFDVLILSAQYNARRWDLTAEYALRSNRFRDYGPLLPDTSYVGESYYLQAAYRFAPQWETVVRYDRLYWDREDRDGSAFAALTGLPAHRRFAKDLMVGLRWDVTPSFMLRTEFHYIDGTGWLSELENPVPSATERYWTLFAVLGSYRF
ncbi:hypothetical protein [Thiocystis violacea]|uniref:hypothetical protein n=1 Tax=Thiocystis violacea TaxID=13725 RepID=UPI001904EE46|nr:hypothetical protein [Thiocystis violacea]MBK1722469.1 hypothetical protein [Thiocystis violacea]